MDALLIALLAIALIEQGDRLQRLGLIATAQYKRGGAVAAGLILSVLANALIAAVAGMLARDLVPYRALTLLLALALLSAGGGALVRAKPPGVIAYARLGAIGGPAFAGFVLGFGGAAQFLVFAIAARAGSVVLPTLGATLGAAAAILPACLGGEPLVRRLTRIRIAVGILFLLVGAVVALAALRLI